MTLFEAAIIVLRSVVFAVVPVLLGAACCYVLAGSAWPRR
jgi:hypothetical protein